MEVIMKDSGTIISKKERESTFIQLAISMMDDGQVARQTAMEGLCQQVAMFTKVTGWTICKMARAKSAMKMELYLKVAFA